MESVSTTHLMYNEFTIRERRAAVEALATIVWQIESQLRPKDAVG